MKIEYNKKSIVRFRDLKAGDLFCEIDEPAEEIMMKTVDVFRPDCSMLNTEVFSRLSYATHTEVKETLRWLERKGLIVSYYCPSMRQPRYYLSAKVKHLIHE